MHKKIAGFSPLTETSYYILLSLFEPLHGYGIMKKVEKMSQGRVLIAAGTLYGAFTSLLNNQLIVLAGEDENNSRRKVYQITELGKALIHFEINRLQEMVSNGLAETGGKA